MRSLIITGWDGEALALGFGLAAAIAAAAIAAVRRRPANEADPDMSRFLDVTHAVAWRTIHNFITNPAYFFPSLIFPLFFFTAFAGGLSSVGNVPGFDFPAGYTAFQFVFVLLQAAAFGGVFTGFGIAADFEKGFARRLLLGAPNRLGILAGYARRGAGARARSSASCCSCVALATGMQVIGGGVDLFGLVVLAALVNLTATFFAAGVAFRTRTIQAGPAMQMPVFIVLFLAPVFVPLDLLVGGWVHTVAQVNPVTALLEGGRDLISGQSFPAAVAFGIAVALPLAVLGLGGARAAPRGGRRARRAAAGVRTERGLDRHPRVARADRAERAADGDARRRGRGLRAGVVVGPLLAVERAPGRVRVRLVVARRRDAGDRDAVRRRQRARPALPPGDRRPGRRDAGGDVPGPAVRSRSAPASSPTSTSPASRGRARRCATRGCASASTSCARCSRARSSTTTGSSPSTGRSSGPCPPSRRRCSPRRSSVETAAFAGEWADGLITINQPREHLERMLAAFREHGGEGKPVAVQVHLSWAETEEEALRDRARPVAHERLPAAAVLGPRDRRAVRPRRDARAPRGHARAGAVSSDLARHVAWIEELGGARLRRRLPAPRRPGAAPLHRRLRRARPPGAMRAKATSDLWWKNAVVYCLDVETFLDSDGDGCGDLRGLTDRLDYLAGLGVSCLWLMPFYPSRQRDDGYDITDFYGVDGRLGTPGRLRRADPHGRRPRHPRDRRPRRQPHVRPAPVVPGGPRPRLAATTTSTSGRTRSPRRSPATSSSPTRRTPTGPTTAKARQWYLHRFYSHQPDLNVAQPGGPRRDRPGRRLLAHPGPGRLPRRRGAVPARADRDAGGRARTTRTSCCATCAASSAAAAATRS